MTNSAALDRLLSGTSTSPFICLEVNPPRGVDISHIISRLEGQLSGLDFLNITDSALARMKLAALPFGAILKRQFGIEPLVNIACRDRNLIALQADLLAGWALGVRSVVALTGDAVTIGDSPERKSVFEVNSVGLLNTIKSLNSGKDVTGNDLKGSPAISPGVVVNPNARNTGAELKRLQRKKDAGALYALSQPVFDEEGSLKFFSQAKAIGVPIFMGLLPIKSAHAAQGIMRVPGIKISEKVAAKISNAGDADLSDFSIEHCLTLARLNREHVCGFHVVSGTTPVLALRLAKELVGLRNSL